MGHYLFIKLLKIEDNEKISLNRIVDNVRMKIADHKEVKEINGRIEELLF